MKAAREGLVKNVEMMIATMTSTEISFQDSSDGFNALHWAIHKGHPRVVSTLLQRIEPEDLMRKSTRGHTPLTLAAQKGRIACLRVMLPVITRYCTREEISARVNGRHAVDIARLKGHKACAELLSTVPMGV